jgi:hypothetical protein
MSKPLTINLSMRVRPVSGLQARTLTWLWPGRLALGKLAILDGDPELGKSLLALDLCARLSTGRPWPDGSPGSGPAPALYLNGEDGDEDTVAPRLAALGGDPARVFVWEREAQDAAGLLRLPTQVTALDEALAQVRPRLVVLDPVVAFLDRTVLGASDQSVRRALWPLAVLAAKYDCVILLIRHLNKYAAAPAIYRGGGSIGFVAACRSAWLVAPDPGDAGRRVLAQVKNNLAPRQPSLAYRLDSQDTGPPLLTWLGTSPLTADQLLRGEAAAPAEACARDFLLALLKDGPRTSDQVWAAAAQADVAERTLFRAKKEAGVRTERVHFGRGSLSYWLLPDQVAPSAPPAMPAWREGMTVEEWVAKAEEVYPSARPGERD